MVEISSVVRGRGDPLLSALVGMRLLLLDSEAWGAPFELLADKDLSTVVIMLGMSAEVTILGVFFRSLQSLLCFLSFSIVTPASFPRGVIRNWGHRLGF